MVMSSGTGPGDAHTTAMEEERARDFQRALKAAGHDEPPSPITVIDRLLRAAENLAAREGMDLRTVLMSELRPLAADREGRDRIANLIRRMGGNLS